MSTNERRPERELEAADTANEAATDFGIPTAELLSVSRPNKAGNRTVRVRCPYGCKHGKRGHIHGVGPDGRGGHRVAHCADGRPNRGYYVPDVSPIGDGA